MTLTVKKKSLDKTSSIVNDFLFFSFYIIYIICVYVKLYIFDVQYDEMLCNIQEKKNAS